MKVDLKGKRAVVVGLGQSGLAAARLLQRVGAAVVGNDQSDTPALRTQLEEMRVEACLGGHPVEVLSKADYIVVSPGVPPLPQIEDAVRSGAAAISEVELASWFIESDVVAITGTNGKSTVTSLVGAMLKEQADRPVFVGGNLGTPLTDVAFTEAAAPGGVAVVELSSFQLERIHDFRARTGVVLNVSADHLDRYDSFEAYATAKSRVFENQVAGDHAVAWSEDDRASLMARAGKGSPQFFGEGGTARIDGGVLVDDESSLRVPISELSLRGQHNAVNGCAAALIGRLAGAGPNAIEHVLRTFPGLPHRMELVRRLDEVDWLNDSKATNVGAAVASVDGAPGSQVVLIAGGVDKGALMRRSRKEWVDEVAPRCSSVKPHR